MNSLVVIGSWSIDRSLPFNFQSSGLTSAIPASVLSLLVTSLTSFSFTSFFSVFFLVGGVSSDSDSGSSYSSCNRIDCRSVTTDSKWFVWSLPLNKSFYLELKSQ